MTTILPHPFGSAQVAATCPAYHQSISAAYKLVSYFRTECELGTTVNFRALSPCSRPGFNNTGVALVMDLDHWLAPSDGVCDPILSGRLTSSGVYAAFGVELEIGGLQVLNANQQR